MSVIVANNRFKLHLLVTTSALLSLGLAPSNAMSQAVTTEASEPASLSGIPEWGIASPDFDADPAVTFGTLPNGMRYAIRQNANPPGEAVIRFTVDVGGRDETDAEHGAAHFVEHMAFNGSTNIPEGQLLPMLERLGLAFGADTNAETSLDYTTYRLDLPSTDAETVDTAFTVIREMAGRLTFDAAAVERERGIILREAQDRNDANRRRAADYLEAALPGSQLGERVTSDIARIQGISPEELRAFYQAYYRPERTTFVIVGDVDPNAMQARIEAVFVDWQGSGEARGDYQYDLAETQTPTISNFVDPATPEIIEIQALTQWQPDDNTLAGSREEVLRAIAGAALTNRINALSRAPDSPTLGAQAMEQPLFRTANSYGLLIVAKDGQWRETMELGEREMRRAIQYGFTQSEIDEVKANIDTALRNAVVQAGGRTSSTLAEALIAASLTDAVVTTPETDLAFYEQIAPSITAEATSEAFARAFANGPDIIHVSTKAPVDGGEQAIAQAFANSAQVSVTPPEEAAAVAFAYTDWGAPGMVVEDEMIADLGIRTILFANGVQLNIKRTDFEPSQVLYAMRVGSGSSAFPVDKPGLTTMLPVVASIDGLAAHDPDELRRILAGRQVGIDLVANNAALVASGATTPTDLELQMQLLAARVTATAYRDNTQAQWAGVAPVIVENIRATPIQVFVNTLNAALSGGDARLGFLDPGSLAEISLDDLRGVIEPQLASGSIAIGLVGDVDEQVAIEAVASTLGALPARQPRTEMGNQRPALAFAPQSNPLILRHAGEPDQGVLSLSWPTDDGDNLADDMAREVLAAVFNLRLTETLREEFGAAYSPEAFSFSTTTYDGFGHITALATMPLAAMDEGARIIAQIADELSAMPVSTDLLERARSPIREGFERAESQNSAWLSFVTMAQSDPENLDGYRQRQDILAAITPEVVQETARRYLSNDRLAEIRVIPEERAGSGE